jgi:methyltransferase NSUN6
VKVLSAAKPSAKDGLLNVAGFYPESFDRILLDPPCSALGLRPKLSMANTSLADLESVCAYQRQFIANAIALLKPGGYMTYSTCTIHTKENEGMVRYLLDHYPSMELVPISLSVGGSGLPGLLTPWECRAVRRFDPSDRVNDAMGFFVAKFRKLVP